MSKKTGLLRRTAAVAAFSGVAFAMSTGTASAATVTTDAPYDCSTQTGDAPDLSPSTQKAWADFICGGSYLAGGAARMVSGAWVGAPGTLMAGATGTPMTPEQIEAWEDWNEGAHEGGQGAAMIIAGAYVGAPGYIYDKMANGATPGDLSQDDLEKVSFLMPENHPSLEDIPTDQVPNPMSPVSPF